VIKFRRIKLDKITTDELLKKVGSRYALVSLVARRAQEMLAEGDKPMKASKIISKIFGEIARDEIRIKRVDTDEGKQEESK
jgi:DNA-directed RNA polymerase omega subunit